MGDCERETASSPPSDQQDSEGKTCEYCGDVIDTSEWYPATTERDADGRLQIFAFCREACKDAWLGDRSE